MTNQEKIDIANFCLNSKAIELLNECKTPIGSVIGDNEFKTVVNAITLEVEASMIMRFVNYLQDIKNANFHDDN